MIAFHTLPQSATHTRGFLGWLMATLMASSSHIQDFTIWILSPTSEVFISLLKPWDRLYFPKMAMVIAPILHDLTVWLWPRHAPHQVLGLFPHPHVLNTGRHLWRPQTTERGVMTLYDFWHRSSPCQVLLPYFLGFSFLEYTSCAVHEPKSLTETLPTHQLVKNSWCLFNMLTSFSNFLNLKIFLYTSRD